jgi:UDPglucose 6-dehydrogenase
MQIGIIGGGYVGLVSGACFAEFGTDVVIMDVDARKIEALRNGKVPIYEPGLNELIAANVADGRLKFTNQLDEAVHGAAAVFLAVGTPARRGDGHADLTYVFAAAEQVAKAATRPLVLVTKSTVPVGTGRKVMDIVRRVRPDMQIDVASNPEFLREGSAIGDFMRPDRVVIGVESDRAEAVLKRLYRPLYLLETPIVQTTIETAEMIKYAANAFLALKITFINQIADLCEKTGADVQDVARGMGLDGRIGKKFLHTGPGFGGSCFPKDTLALARTARELGAPMTLVDEAITSNDRRKLEMADRILAAFNGDVTGRTIAVLGLTFKPETDDVREAPSLAIIPRLLEHGARVRAYDPQPQGAREVLPAGIHYAESALEAAEGADLLVLLTEWNEFRALAPEKLKSAMRGNLVFDLRNVWEPEVFRQSGFVYHSLGRP